MFCTNQELNYAEKNTTGVVSVPIILKCSGRIGPLCGVCGSSIGTAPEKKSYGVANSGHSCASLVISGFLPTADFGKNYRSLPHYGGPKATTVFRGGCGEKMQAAASTQTPVATDDASQCALSCDSAAADALPRWGTLLAGASQRLRRFGTCTLPSKISDI